MSQINAFLAREIFDGERWHTGAAVLAADGLIKGVVPAAEIPAGAVRINHDGMLAPGFIDLQVNGGGGVMLNDHPDLASIRTICAAHVPFGTTKLLPTLITDTREITAAAVAAGVEAARRKVPGFLGLHLEGPHLSVARKGAHDPALIRPLDEDSQAFLIDAAGKLPLLLTTVAPESAPPERIAALTAAGIVVSLGHSDTTYSIAKAAAEAGASMATHLFNAMSQIGNREAGLAGAAIDIGTLSAGLIADGIHVDPATIAIALRGKRGPARIFLVTDAMATIGTDMPSFTLNGRTVYRKDGRLTLADGTLAGADLDMISAVRFMHRVIGLDLGEALRMASLYPAESIGRGDRLGRFVAGAPADMVALTSELEVAAVWIDGLRAFAAN